MKLNNAYSSILLSLSTHAFNFLNGATLSKQEGES